MGAPRCLSLTPRPRLCRSAGAQHTRFRPRARSPLPLVCVTAGRGAWLPGPVPLLADGRGREAARARARQARSRCTAPREALGQAEPAGRRSLPQLFKISRAEGAAAGLCRRAPRGRGPRPAREAPASCPALSGRPPPASWIRPRWTGYYDSILAYWYTSFLKCLSMSVKCQTLMRVFISVSEGYHTPGTH